MTTLREAAQMALDALQESKPIDINDPTAFYRSAHAIEALRTALAQPEQEPVAWMHNFIDEVVTAHRPVDLDRHPDRWTPLYKDPTPCQTCESLARTVMMDQTYHDSVMAQREWHGLTDEDFIGLTTPQIFAMKFAEAKLKEKNA